MAARGPPSNGTHPRQAGVTDLEKVDQGARERN